MRVHEFANLFQGNLQKLLFVKIYTLENLALAVYYDITLRMCISATFAPIGTTPCTVQSRVHDMLKR